jgi:hypothetical protein
MECESLAALIGDFGDFDTYEAYAATLRAAHGGRTAFWGHVS